MTLYRITYFLNLSLLRFTLSQNGKDFIFVQHPELPHYFDKVSKSNPQMEPHFLHYLRGDEKIVKRQQTLDTIIYRSLPSRQNLSPALNPDIITNLLNDVEDLYKRDILKGIQLIEVTLQLSKRVVLIPALPCILHVNFFWFITPGFHSTNEYFVLEKYAGNENFHLSGITEPAPNINKEISYDQLQIEVHFLKNYRSAENIEKFRLCSSAHIAWRETARRQIYQVNSAHDDASVCIENAVVSFEKISQENTGFPEPITIHLLGCAINAPRSDPQFYLAADQNILNAAFVLQKHGIENEKTVYQLFIHILDISSLKKESDIIRTLYEYQTDAAA